MQHSYHQGNGEIRNIRHMMSVYEVYSAMIHIHALGPAVSDLARSSHLTRYQVIAPTPAPSDESGQLETCKMSVVVASVLQQAQWQPRVAVPPIQTNRCLKTLHARHISCVRHKLQVEALTC